jgi:hypothetical protein
VGGEWPRDGEESHPGAAPAVSVSSRIFSAVRALKLVSSFGSAAADRRRKGDGAVSRARGAGTAPGMSVMAKEVPSIIRGESRVHRGG